MSKIYTFDGSIIDFDELYEGKPFFRKMSKSVCELAIYDILMNHGHNHIVNVYRIGFDFIDMELLSVITTYEDSTKIKQVMGEVKNYLQEKGIIYIDWKLDNIGLSCDNHYKLFDFDGSGIIDTVSKEWIKEANRFYCAYRQAICAGITCPLETDDYCFQESFV